MAYKQIDRFDWFMYFSSTERGIPHQKCFFFVLIKHKKTASMLW